MLLINDIFDEIIDKDIPDDMKVMVSNKVLLVNEFGSDRGDYNDMYIGYTHQNSKEPTKWADWTKVIETIGELKALLHHALEVGTMEGYKGGDFPINRYTVVRVGSYGGSGHHMSHIEVKDDIAYIVIGVERYVELWEDGQWW